MVCNDEKEVDRIAQELYEKSGRRFTPAFPWVFVRVLKKAQKIGHIVVPDTQNKTIHEGIVLATWRRSPAVFFNVNSSKWEAPQRFISELTPGDHVIFPHIAGMPIPGYDTGLYRVIKECNWTLDREGGIVGVVEQESAQEVRRVLLDLICDECDLTTLAIAEDAATRIMERFILVDREKQSATLSGV
jgi:hypothetical protein